MCYKLPERLIYSEKITEIEICKMKTALNNETTFLHSDVYKALSFLIEIIYISIYSWHILKK